MKHRHRACEVGNRLEEMVWEECRLEETEKGKDAWGESRLEEMEKGKDAWEGSRQEEMA